MMTSGSAARTDYDAKQREIIGKVEEFVREKLHGDASGHDWWHIDRVRNNAVRIAEGEDVDHFVVELGALLHDIDDWKFNGGDLNANSRLSRKLLLDLSVDTDIVERVCHIIDNVSYKGAGVENTMQGLEGKVVQDADRLDSIGAIAIARTFAYGGVKGRPIHDPAVAPELHETFEQYKKSQGPSINHFYEKLLLIKDRLNTKTGRQIAESRHAFMEKFLEQFLAEWDARA
jgi:uncharacterized protein